MSRVRPPNSASRARGLVVVASTLAAAAACSVLVDAEREQCTTDAECVGHVGLGPGALCVDYVCQPPAPVFDSAINVTDAPPSDSAWGCVGRTIPPIDPNAVVQVFARFQSLDGAPLGGLSVKACNALDLLCTAPFEGTPKNTDDAGLVEMYVSVPTRGGFKGYLETGPSDSSPALAPTLFNVQLGSDNVKLPSEAGSNSPRYPVQLLESEDLERLASAVGATLNPDLGHLVFTVLDCERNLASNTVVKSGIRNADTRLSYFDDSGNPSTALEKTTSSGRGAFLNLPSGTSVSLLLSDGRQAATENVITRKGSISYIFIAPRL